MIRLDLSASQGDFVEGADLFGGTSGRETNSMATISAASPIRLRVFTIRVYSYSGSFFKSSGHVAEQLR